MTISAFGNYSGNYAGGGYAGRISYGAYGSALAAAGSGGEDRNLPGISDGKKAPGEECETCKRRKYQDGSDEMVSFKTPQHISPENAAASVRAHEQEHVSNAYSDAAMKNGKVLRASVSIQTAICPECGRSYISGGTTNTQIKYYNEENPYQKDLKTADRAKYVGMHADYVA